MIFLILTKRNGKGITRMNEEIASKQDIKDFIEEVSKVLNIKPISDEYYGMVADHLFLLMNKNDVKKPMKKQKIFSYMKYSICDDENKPIKKDLIKND